MPKVYITREQEMNEALLRNLRGRLARKNKLRSEDAGQLIHSCAKTWRSRMKDPGDFRLTELRRLFDGVGVSNEEILEIFGRKMK